MNVRLHTLFLLGAAGVFFSRGLSAKEVLSPGWTPIDLGEGTYPSFVIDENDNYHVIALRIKPDKSISFFYRSYSYMGEQTEPFDVADGGFEGPADMIFVGDTLHMAAHDHTTEGPKHFTKGPNDSSFIEHTINSPDAHDGWDAILAKGPTGNVHLAADMPYGQIGPPALQYGIFRDNSWTFTQAVPESGEFIDGLGLGLAVDSQDNPHILYCETKNFTSGGSLNYATKMGFVWTITPVVETGNPGRFPSLLIDPEDNLHACWFDVDPADSSHAILRYGLLNAGSDTWQITTVDELNHVFIDDMGARKSISMKRASNGDILIAYGDKRTVKYAVNSIGAWITNTVLSEETDSFNGLVFLELNSLGNPSILFWETTTSLGKIRMLVAGVASPDFNVTVHISQIPVGLHLNWNGPEGARYSIENSSDLKSWETLTNSVTGIEGLFEFTDSEPLNGKRFYRLVE